MISCQLTEFYDRHSFNKQKDLYWDRNHSYANDWIDRAIFFCSVFRIFTPLSSSWYNQTHETGYVKKYFSWIWKHRNPFIDKTRIDISFIHESNTLWNQFNKFYYHVSIHVSRAHITYYEGKFTQNIEINFSRKIFG